MTSPARWYLCDQVTFEDVIAEPVSVRSGDRIWIWSNALFEVSKVWIYRIVTVLLAIPMSVISGLLFAILSCFHIWWVYAELRGLKNQNYTLWTFFTSTFCSSDCVCFSDRMIRPCTRCVLIGTHWLQSLWSIVLDVIVRPFLTSAGRCCGGFSIHLAKE